MAITIKTVDEIEHMRVAGTLAASVLDMIAPHVIPGVTTDELDRLCHDYIVNDLDAIPAPLNYRNFPKSICTSVNHVICHGIPGDKKLKKGDIINIDITVIKNGFHGDTSKMFVVGDTAPPKALQLVEIARTAMLLGIKTVKPGKTLGDIGATIQQFVESKRCSVVREYCGHGIGRAFHEDPQVLHYGKSGKGTRLEEGMTFTIEPMVNAGRRHVRMLPDKWTVVTRDRSLSAQWEHTVLVTPDGYEVLTARDEEHDLY
jgi:methionyl aminopeptidase